MRKTLREVAAQSGQDEIQRSRAKLGGIRLPEIDNAVYRRVNKTRIGVSVCASKDADQVSLFFFLFICLSELISGNLVLGLRRACFLPDSPLS